MYSHGQKSVAGWYEKLGFEQDEDLVEGSTVL